MNYISNLSRCDNLIKSIQKDPTLPEITTDEFSTKLNGIIDIITKCNILETEQSLQTSKLENIVHLIKELDGIVDNQTNLTESKIKKIHAKLSKACNILTEKQPVKNILQSKIDSKFAFFCDIDSPDHNGAITSRIVDAINQNIPFITTRSLISGSQFEKTSSFLGRSNEIEETLIDKKSEWDIYQQDHPTFGREFLIFIPKSKMGENKNSETLDSLDLTCNERIKKVTLRDAFTPPEHPANLEAFFALFNEKPQKSKLIYIGGHGGVGRPAGLTKENYKKFLHFLNEHQCKGLTITSCYAGGKSSLLVDEEAHLSFPVIARSIGDFTTVSGQSAEKNISLYFDELASFLESNKGATVSEFRVALRKAEQKGEKKPSNLAQVYFPHSPGSPGGFRPIGERGDSYSLTYNKLLRETHESVIKKRNGIDIEDKEFLEIHPLVVDQPLIFKKKIPIFLSMIPGDAHHWLQEIDLVQAGPLEFLVKISKFYKENSIGVDKAFIIQKLASTDQTWNQVMLHLEEDKMNVLYRENEQYYLWDGTSTNVPKTISPFEYALYLHSYLRLTLPEQKAIRSQTGGHQNDELMKQMIETDSFWQGRKNIWIEHSQLLDQPALSSMSQEHLETLLQTELKDLTNREKENLVFHFLRADRADLAKIMIEHEGLSSSMTDLKGIPLLYAAITKKEIDFVRYLIQKGADVNGIDPVTSRSCLRQAAILDNIELTTLLLTSPAINLEHKDKIGRTAIFSPIMNGNKDIYHLLREKGADPNVIDSQEDTILSWAIRKSNEKLFEDLLTDEHLNLNFGDPCPLLLSIIKANPKWVELLLKKGADIYQESNTYYIYPPIFEVMLRGTPEMVKMVFDHKDFNPNFKNSKGITPLLIAISIGNAEYINTLLDRGAIFSDDKFGNIDFLTRGIKRLLAFNDIATIQLLLKRDKTGQISSRVTKCADTNPQAILDLIKGGFISSSDSIYIVLDSAKNNFEKYKIFLEAFREQGLLKNVDYYLDEAAKGKELQLVDYFLSMGASIHPQKDKRTDPLSNAVKNYEPKLGKTPLIIKKLVELGADLNAIEDDYATPLACFIRSDDLELFDWCLSHGIQVNPQNTNNKMTPLDMAIAHLRYHDNAEKIFKKLVDAGADLNPKETSDSTPIINLLATGKLDLIKYVFEKGAQIKDGEMKKQAIAAAVKSSDIAIIQFLSGIAIIPSADDVDGEGLLAEAYLKSGNDMFDEIFRYSKEPVIKDKDKDEFWKKVMRKNDVEVLRKLSKFPKLMQENKTFIQKYAVQFAEVIEIFKELEKQNIEIDPEDILKYLNELKNITPNQQKIITTYFLEKVTDPNNKKEFIQQLLCLGMKSEFELTRTMISLGANINEKVKYQGKKDILIDYPIFIAIFFNSVEFVQLFLDSGVDLTVKSGSKTVLESAKEKGNDKIIKLIEEALAKT